MRRILPLPRTPGQKWLAGALAALVCAVLYTTSSMATRQRAVELAMFGWERAIPFWPFSVWAYVAQYPMLLVAFVKCGDISRCGRFLYAAVIVQATAAMTYLVYPIRMARPPLPDLSNLDSMTIALVHGVRAIDAPVNCLPSLHVTSCLLCLFLIARESRWFVACFAIASVICIASTLTFKQHYFVDLPVGAVLAAAGWAIAARLTALR